jgi:hypothetical protein
MDSGLLAPPFDPAALAGADTATLKASLLQQVEGRDTEAMAKKVRFANDTLLPLLTELERRNLTPDLNQQIPLLKGIWHPVWSTIPFQDIIPGRVHRESYQIFDDNGFYANLARYKPGRKIPILSWLSRWLLSYDFMIMQSYGVQTQVNPDQTSDLEPQDGAYWEIQNVCIRQVLRLGSPSLSADAAQAWFDQTLVQYQQNPKSPLPDSIPKSGNNRVQAKQYQKIAEAKPRLEHLYIDRDFRLVKTQRETKQRPSYTLAIRLP